MRGAALDARGACLVAPARPPRGSSARVVVVTGVNARQENEFDVDLALSKLAYASAHASLRFAFYCADDFAEALAAQLPALRRLDEAAAAAGVGR